MYPVQPAFSKLSNLITVQHLLIVLLCSTVVTIAGLQYILSFYTNHLPLNTYIHETKVENLTLSEAQAVVETRLPAIEHQAVTVLFEDVKLSSDSAELGYSYDAQSSLETAQSQYNELPFFKKLSYLYSGLSQQHGFGLQTKTDPDKVATFISTFNDMVMIPSEDPQATLARSGNAQSLTISSGKVGREVNKEATAETIAKSLGQGQFEITPTISATGKELSDIELLVAKDRATKYVGFNRIFKYDTTRLYLTDVVLISLLELPQGVSEKKLDELLETWKKTVERPPQDAVFAYNPETLQVTEFTPSRDGLTIDKESLSKIITENTIRIIDENPPEKIDLKPPELAIPVKTTQPEKPLAQTNQLGIKERVAVGESWYRGSIPSRIHNVSLAASRIANYIVKPGEEFSFNTAIGDVSAATGYQSAYVIMNGQTVLGDGGGVCQVSTTLFRALLNGGIDITRRLPHSYRVGYYEQNFPPGIDATVFSGNVDLRFKNDTPGHLLIHTTVDSKNQYMIVELYGTSDGRSGEITDVKQWDATPALPPQYIPDPSLAPGQTKQIDWAVGGLKTSFRHIVKDKDGKVITDKVYTSTYRPWAAKYLQGV